MEGEEITCAREGLLRPIETDLAGGSCGFICQCQIRYWRNRVGTCAENSAVAEIMICQS